MTEKKNPSNRNDKLYQQPAKTFYDEVISVTISFINYFTFGARKMKIKSQKICALLFLFSFDLDK